jgi:hypothetical protein
MRNIPDVSFFAGAGVWAHYYVMCRSDVRNPYTPALGCSR